MLWFPVCPRLMWGHVCIYQLVTLPRVTHLALRVYKLTQFLSSRFSDKELLSQLFVGFAWQHVGI